MDWELMKYQKCFFLFVEMGSRIQFIYNLDMVKFSDISLFNQDTEIKR